MTDMLAAHFVREAKTFFVEWHPLDQKRFSPNGLAATSTLRSSRILAALAQKISSPLEIGIRKRFCTI